MVIGIPEDEDPNKTGKLKPKPKFPVQNPKDKISPIMRNAVKGRLTAHQQHVAHKTHVAHEQHLKNTGGRSADFKKK